MTASLWTGFKDKTNKGGGKTYPVLQNAGNSGTGRGDLISLRLGDRHYEDLGSPKNHAST